MMNVVAGLAYLKGNVLLGKRKASGKRGSLWEMPGGKVEALETKEEALIREWREELAVDVVVGTSIAVAHLDLEVKFSVYLYEVSSLRIEHAALLDHEELMWVNLQHAITYLPCSPAMYLHYPEVRRWLQGKYGR
jgi:8-oxo-dGTP diphosphatase